MIITILAIIIGFILLVWSADKFVAGASAAAKHSGLSPLLIGILIVGFGTSAPEMVVSAMAAIDGNPALALGNAIGSNIVNISLILGVTALIAPIMVNSSIIKKEIPLLIGISFLIGFFLWDNQLNIIESTLLLLGFFSLIAWSIYESKQAKNDSLAEEMDQELQSHEMTLMQSILWLSFGLIMLIASSRLLVWGAVEIAVILGISDLIIGLTIVALGTSLPELAASIIAARKGEHDIAIGNVVGSNMFNLLAVIGIAGLIEPMNNIPTEVMSRDWPTMMFVTLSLLIMAYGFKKRSGRINRLEGFSLITIYVSYNLWLVFSTI